VDPHSVRLWQVWPWVGASLVLALLFGQEGALCVALASAVAALVWAGLVARYRRGCNNWVSAERREGDRVMDLNALLALGPALVLACAVAAAGLDPVLDPVWTAFALSLPLLCILTSSAIDWYVILPFRDGVVGLPVCRLDSVSLVVRRRYTKLWVAHRLLCEMSIAGSLLAAAILLTHHYAHDLGPIVTIVGALGSSAAAARVAWDRWILGGLRFCLRQGPALGNWVVGPSYSRKEGERTREGLVLDVSLDNGLKVVAHPGATEHFIALKDAVPDISDKQENYACCEGECKAWLGAGSDQSGVTCEVYRRRLMTVAQPSGR
jgi:hypothetical protein